MNSYGGLCCVVKAVACCKWCGWKICGECLGPIYRAESTNHEGYNSLVDIHNHEDDRGELNCVSWIGQGYLEMK